MRNFVHVALETPKGILHVLTHHGFRDPNTKDGSDENTRQMKIIASYIDSLEGPIILAGDFNLHPKSKSLQPIHDRLTNLCTKYDLRSTRSELAKRQEVIDYIFVSDDISVKDFHASEMILSDHKALILDFDMK